MPDVLDIRHWRAGAADVPHLSHCAVAAAIAWYLAPFVPFADNDYSYYAPLGVLVSMHLTLAASARVGAQSLIGLGIGIALGLGGLGLVRVDVPGVIAVAAVIGIADALVQEPMNNEEIAKATDGLTTRTRDGSDT
ncbi:hypothetical protein DC31_14370 [Microbacterium sp. CH12i]|uniref:hypothetical protein n=1 Tax=Microbacterium sp. CH12i TaxID=1479651 RepID=UPI000461E67D|nr:hypothetical protein [Microbacterium sp. CH12i]KDA05874.1 hypothetical protein DC31_14370 [Microbacterium sp. CH12i]